MEAGQKLDGSQEMKRKKLLTVTSNRRDVTENTARTLNERWKRLKELKAKQQNSG